MLLDKIFKHNKQPVEMYCGNMIEKAESVNANLEESDNVLKEEFQMKSEKRGDFLLWNMSDLEARDLCKNRIDAIE